MADDLTREQRVKAARDAYVSAHGEPTRPDLDALLAVAPDSHLDLDHRLLRNEHLMPQRKTKEQIAQELADLEREDSDVDATAPAVLERIVIDYRQWNPDLKRWEDVLPA